MASGAVQAPSAVVMVRPHHFKVNAQTATDNAFQRRRRASKVDAHHAYQEITASAQTLAACGVRVHLFDDHRRDTPDSVFPNNWFSTHGGGHVAIYPMKAPNRRLERRQDVIDMLKTEYRIQNIIDYSGLEQDGIYLEGTGAMVLDHVERVAYAVSSDRTNPIALERFCTHFNFEPMVFPAADRSGRPIYHTNVLMTIATGFVLICLDMITDPVRREDVAARLAESGREIILLSKQQVECFAGNALELQGSGRRILALSQTAFSCLDADQLAAIRATADPIVLDIKTIENAGGSVRCTLAGIHLSRRSLEQVRGGLFKHGSGPSRPRDARASDRQEKGIVE